jgi:hypothetical protein
VGSWLTDSLRKPYRAYVVGNHGMAYRYSIVSVEYKVPNMVDAPIMPAEAQKAAAAPVRAAR